MDQFPDLLLWSRVLPLSITLLLLAAAIAAFVTEAVSIELIAGLLMVGLILTGVLSPEAGISGFANPALVTIACMFVISNGILRTGAVGFLARRLIRLASGDERKLIFFTAIVVAFLSAFINNSPVVAVFVPLILGVSRETGIAPSRLLMPVSFASILGGTMTMLGTSTNLLVSQVVLQKDHQYLGPLALLDFAPVGIVLVVLGVVYLVFFGIRRLPVRQGVATGPAVHEYMTEVVVQRDSRLLTPAGRQELLTNENLRLVQVVRGDRLFWPPYDDFELQVGDVLLVKGRPQTIYSLLEEAKVDLAPELSRLTVDLRTVDTTLAEVVLTPGSRYIGRTIGGIGFRYHHQVAVVGLQRRGSHHRGEIAGIPLRLGDVLLVHGPRENIERLRNEDDFLLVEGVEEGVVQRRKAPLALAFALALICGAYVDVRLLMPLALLASTVLILSRCLTSSQAFRSIDWTVILLIGGMLALGRAMEQTGAAQFLASGLTAGLTGVGLPAGLLPWIVLSGLCLLTMLMTEFVSNNATAVVMAHIAFVTADSLELSPAPFVFAVAYGASLSFCTPIGYQTNTFVLGPGNYRFGDFFRVGFPLSILSWITVSLLVPLVFGFEART